MNTSSLPLHNPCKCCSLTAGHLCIILISFALIGVLYLWIALATIVLIWMAVSYHSVAGTKLDSLLGKAAKTFS